MATHLACIGLGTDRQQAFQRLVAEADQAAQQEEVIGGVRVHRWEDGSGAAIVLGWRGGELISFMPAFAAMSELRLANCHPVREPVAVADVLDRDGTQVTALAAEVEQYQQLVAAGCPADGTARITAFGLSVKVHDDEDAFHAAPKQSNDATHAADFVPSSVASSPCPSAWSSKVAHARLICGGSVRAAGCRP